MTGCIFNIVLNWGEKSRYYRITASYRLPRVATIKHLIERILSIILAAGLILTVATYYLATKPQANAFPTYLSGLAFLPLCLYPARLSSIASNPVIRLGSALILYLVLTTVWSETASIKTTSLYFGFALLLLAFVAGIVFCADTWPTFLNWIITIIILAAAVSALYSIYLFYALDYHPLDEKDRLYALGRIHNPAIGAFSYGIALVFATTRLVYRTRMDERIGWGIATLTLLYAVMMTDTRSAWVGLLAAAVSAIAFSGSLALRARLVSSAALVALAAIALFIGLHSDFRDEIMRRSTSFRPEIWSATLHKFSGAMWLVGDGANAPSFVNDGRFTFDHPHSIYVATLFYGGAIGMVLLLVVITAAYRALLRSRTGELRTMALAGLTFGAIGLLFDGDHLLDKIDYVWMVLWFPITLAACQSSSLQH